MDIEHESWKEQAANLRRQGLSFEKISLNLHISKPRVRHFLTENGFPQIRRKKAVVIDDNTLRSLYIDQKLTIREIVQRFHTSYYPVACRLEDLGIKRNRSEDYALARAKGIPAPGTKRGYICANGYILRKSLGHPRATQKGYVLEHILVWEQHHKQPLPEGWHIHHLNGIRSDNRPSNLVALSPSKHRKKHITLLEERAKRIRELEIENSQLKRAFENSQGIIYIGEN